MVQNKKFCTIFGYKFEGTELLPKNPPSSRNKTIRCNPYNYMESVNPCVFHISLHVPDTHWHTAQMLFEVCPPKMGFPVLPFGLSRVTGVLLRCIHAVLSPLKATTG